MARPSGGQARVFGLRADAPDAGVEIRRRTGFVSDEKDLYGYMSVAEMIRFTAAFFPKWRADLEQRYLQSFELPQQRSVKQLSRGIRTKLALLPAPCRGAELLDLDRPHLRSRPGDDRGGPACARQPRRGGGDDGLLLLAPDRRGRPDRGPRLDHRPRPCGGVGRARRPARELLPHPTGVRGRGAAADVP